MWASLGFPGPLWASGGPLGVVRASFCPMHSAAVAGWLGGVGSVASVDCVGHFAKPLWALWRALCAALRPCRGPPKMSVTICYFKNLVFPENKTQTAPSTCLSMLVWQRAETTEKKGEKRSTSNDFRCLDFVFGTSPF